MDIPSRGKLGRGRASQSLESRDPLNLHWLQIFFKVASINSRSSLLMHF